MAKPSYPMIVPLPKLLMAVFGIPEERANILMKRHGSYALRMLAINDFWLWPRPGGFSYLCLEPWQRHSTETIVAAYLNKPGRVRSFANKAAKLLHSAKEELPGGENRRMYSQWMRAHRHIAKRPKKLIRAMEELRAEVNNTPIEHREANSRMARQWLHQVGRTELLLRIERMHGGRGSGGHGKRKPEK